MSYHFQGVFLQGVPQPLDVLEDLFKGYARPIDAPFSGVGISFREEEWDIDDKELRLKILALSTAVENCSLVYLNYSTWGGRCDYCHGLAAKSGRILEDIAGEEDEGKTVLIRMLTFLGVENTISLFPPFERRFFPNT